MYPPSPSCFHFPFDTKRRGYAPPRRVLTTSTQQGGLVPSLSCSSILFDATRRGMPLLVALLPLEHNGEGTSPPCRVQVSFLTRQGGGAYPLLVMFFPFQCDEEEHTPSSLCCCSHFDPSRPFYLGTIGRVPPSLSCSFCSHFDVMRRDTPSLSRYFHFFIKIVQKYM